MGIQDINVSVDRKESDRGVVFAKGSRRRREVEAYMLEDQVVAYAWGRQEGHMGHTRLITRSQKRAAKWYRNLLMGR